MDKVLLALLTSYGMVLCVNLSTGFTADRKWAAVLLQPVISTVWVLGITSVMAGFWPCVAYVIGSTLGCATGLAIRKKQARVAPVAEEALRALRVLRDLVREYGTTADPADECRAVGMADAVLEGAEGHPV